MNKDYTENLIDDKNEEKDNDERLINDDNSKDDEISNVNENENNDIIFGGRESNIIN